MPGVKFTLYEECPRNAVLMVIDGVEVQIDPSNVQKLHMTLAVNIIIIIHC